MAKELITVPIVMSIVLGLAIELVDIAESTSDKVVEYAESMNSALDCAFRGVDIEYCSPNLASESFKEELLRTKEIMDELKEMNQTELLNLTIDESQLNESELAESY